MASAVSQALREGDHLLVQAGTGTGKSLGYLAPALAHLHKHPDDRVVIATATLALQAQLANSDIPAALDAMEEATGRRPRAAVLKGRSNYACLLRVRDGVGADQESLFGIEPEAAPTPTVTAESALGAEVVTLRSWAEKQASDGGLADRDDAPAHTNRAWTHVSVPVRECLGAQRCPYGEVCFVEKSRELARDADLVVTNHALLAIDAMHGGTALPEYGAAIVDEAHELVARVTGAASAELSPQLIERQAKRALTWLEDDLALEFLELGDTLRNALDDAELARITDPESAVAMTCGQIRNTARKVVSALAGGGNDAPPERRQSAAAVKEIFDIAERMATPIEHDVVWISDRERFGRQLNVAPLSVAGLLRERLLAEHPVVFTSATLKLGGGFTPVATSIGLRAADELPAVPDDEAAAAGTEAASADEAPVDPAVAEGAADEPEDETVHDVDPDRMGWRGIDVGSPFDYPKQGILYLARNLPAPRRDGTADEILAEIAELVWAAGGRTLGLFASQRAAEAAAIHVRQELPSMTVLCQGDAQLPELTRRFISEPDSSLFGTLSLWQGLDVPGDVCRLVLIDKIPFPRPDDPLHMARQQAVAKAGGNGFMAVAASHAALLLAQGAGRLIRRTTDRGVVAVLDPRIVTAGYGSFLRATMPPMWQTSDRETVVGALSRLRGD
ncbi:ATP-dependent DNA helicase [Enemella sp. A6]|uniref:ATP-dependent DNA helicase n=1 Tax=Enemella sp. A6 TaxID=3440152 RepID=UPI003EB6A45D